MSERLPVWECIGCGRIEGQRPCIGVCKDQKVDLVYASDYDAAISERDRAVARVEALTALVRQIAATSPREGEWAHSYRAFQERAKRLLALPAAPLAPSR